MRETSPDRFRFRSYLLFVVWGLLLCFDGTNLTYLLAASMLSLCLLGVWVFRGDGIDVRGLAAVMLAFSALLLLAPFWSIAPYRSWLYGWAWLMLPVAFFLFSSLKMRFSALLPLLAAVGAVLALIGLYQFHVLSSEFHYRATGLLLDANSFAGLLNLLLLPCMAWLMLSRDLKSTSFMWMGMAVVLMLGGVFASGSRVGLLILLFGLLLLMLQMWRQHRPLRVAWILCAVVAFWMLETMFFAGDDMLSRLQSAQSGHDPSLSARFMLWQSCWQLIVSHAWWGTGLGTFLLLYPQVRAVAENETAGAYVHSDPLQLLLEGGWPVLLLVVVILLYAAYYLYTMRSRQWDEHTFPLFAIALSVLLAAAHACVNFNFYNACILFVIGVYLTCLRAALVEEKSMSCPVVVRRVIFPLGATWLGLLLAADMYAADLQQPMKEKGVLAAYSESQCEQMDWLAKLHPSMAGVKLGQGVCALKSQDCAGVKKALAYFDAAILKSPYQAEFYAFAAQLDMLAPQCVKDANGEAKKLLLRALTKNPSYIPARYLLFQIDKDVHWLKDGLKYGLHQNQRNQLEQWIGRKG